MNKNMNSPVRIGVIGCGAIAELYHLPALFAHSQTAASIVLADPNPARLAAMKQKFHAAYAVADYHELIGKVDAVIIAMPPHLHYTAAKWFLDQGIHVLCEKPLTESIVEARELVDAGEKSGAKLAVNQTRRFFATYQKIRELIANGTLGKIESIKYHDGVEFNWPAASPHHFQIGAKGVWSDVGVHLLDSICYWLDAKPILVQSQNDSFGGPEALATVNLEHQGCQIEIKVSRLGRLMNGFEIDGSLGSIKAEAEDWDEFTVHFKNGSRKQYKCASNRLTYTDFAKPTIANLVQVVTGEAEPFVSGRSTLATIELLEQAMNAAKRYPMPWNDDLCSRLSPRGELQGFEFASGREATRKRILITGAAGFLGARIVEAMSLSDFAKPVAAIRQWSRASRIACHPIEVVICDIMDPEQVNKAVQGSDAIVHCAYSDDRESIVEGTRNLLDAAVRYGVHRFVYLSSAEAYGSDQSGIISENTETKPAAGSYGDSKLAAEKLCLQYHDCRLKPTILRPSIIYGPFGASWSMNIAKRLQSGKWGLFDGLGEGTANLVYVDDLVQAIFLSLVKDASQGETFNVNGPDRLTWNTYFQKLNDAMGLPPLQLISTTKSQLRTRVMGTVGSVTSFFKAKFEDRLMEIYLRGGFASRLMKRLKGELDSTPSAGELNNLYSRKANYDDKKICQLLGYSPKFNLDHGIQQTIDWFELHEIAKRPANRGSSAECEMDLAHGNRLESSSVP